MSSREQAWMESPFFYLNFPFKLAGFDLQQHDNPAEQRPRSIKQLFFVALNWVILTYALWQKPLDSGVILTTLLMAPTVVQILIQIHVLRHLTEIKQFTAYLHANTNECTRCLLKLFSFLWITINIAVLFVPHLFSVKWNEIYSVLNLIASLYMALTDIAMTSMPLQLFSVILLYSRQKKMIRLLYRAAKRGREDNIFDLSREITERHTQFEKLFSVHPPGWIIFNFILTTFTLILSYRKQMMGVSIPLTFLNLVTTLPILLMVWVNEQIRQHEGSIVFAYAMGSQSGHREMNPVLSCALHQALSSEFTVWGLLPINRELVFSFISTLLTFSVLVIQFMNGSFITNEQCSYKNFTKVSSPA